MAKSKWRGHDIEFDKVKELWVYSDTKQLVRDNVNIKCGHCGKEATKDGHDGCLGTLIGLMNGCCGHGEEREAYVQFLDSTTIHGKDAVEIQRILKKYSNENKEV